MKRLVSLSILLLSLTMQLQAQDDYVAPVEPQVVERLTQWQDLKFGVIFHWGIYAQAGICESWPICSEDWVERDTTFTYDGYKRWYWSLAESFSPKQFDASQWARAVKNSGAKYMIFTTKHHDGFCMYDTKQTDYSIANYGLKGDPRKDAAREVFDAFRKENLWVGAYFSKPDWHSQYFWWDKYATPNRNINYSLKKYPERWEKFKDFTYNQIEELMTGYGDIDILWLDGGQVATGSRQDIDMDRIGAMARKNQDDILVVDRTVGGKWENYCTPERAIPDKPLGYPWESCIPLGDNWGYVPGDPFKSVNTIISNLVEVTAKGGCLLLGVGPSPQGLIPQNVTDSLSLIGNWLKYNGEAIYSTRSAAVTNSDKVWFTAAKEGNTLYAIAIEPQKSCTDGVIRWKYALPAPGTKISLLSSGKSLKWKIAGDEVIVTIPKGTDLSKPIAFKIRECRPQK